MMLSGGCACGMIRYEMPAGEYHRTLCHCADCRRQSGAPVVAWTMVPVATIRIVGEPTVFRSSEAGRRSFCPTCGTGLFFANAILDRMGMVQVRAATFDDPETQPPAMQVQTAERIAWMRDVNQLPSFERFPVG